MYTTKPSVACEPNNNQWKFLSKYTVDLIWKIDYFALIEYKVIKLLLFVMKASVNMNTSVYRTIVPDTLNWIIHSLGYSIERD